MTGSLLTKEEFLKLISENEDALGVTVFDFADIDIDDFVSDRKITDLKFDRFVRGELALKPQIELYLASLESRAIMAYQAQELIVADSTEEEYEEFKERYFGSFERKPRIAGKSYNGIIEEGTIKDDDRIFEFLIGRTVDIEHIKYAEEYLPWRIHENPLRLDENQELTIPWQVFLSKSGKYFIALCYREWTIYAVKTFCEMDD